MDAITLQSLITESLANRNRTQVYDPRSDEGQSWEKDYGSRKKSGYDPERAKVDAARYDAISGRNRNGGVGAIRKSGLDDSASGVGKALWRQIGSELCLGTRVFAVCVGVTAFIMMI